MTPEELDLLKKLSEENRSIFRMLQDIKLKVEQFSSERKQHWRDEQARRRERSW